MPKKRPSEYEMSQAALADPRQAMEADLARLKGYSTGPDRLAPDDVRGARSPLGGGTHSKDEPPNRETKKHEPKKHGGKKK
jgi:hypothetical protein